MIINTGSVANYSSALTAQPKNEAIDTDETSAAKKNLMGQTFESPGGAAPAGRAEAGGKASDEVLEQLKEQIKETQKLLQAQQQQLAALQTSKLPDQEKATQVMALQQQIAGTMGQLNAQMAALMTLMKGSINTTA